jgi:integrase/recombinase XerD
VHVSTLGALRIYDARRDRLCPSPSSPAFFVNSRGRRLDAHNASHTFADVLHAARIVALPGVRRPRLHDYADVCVMPMFLRTPCSPGVGARKVSA